MESRLTAGGGGRNEKENLPEELNHFVVLKQNKTCTVHCIRNLHILGSGNVFTAFLGQI